MRESRRCSITRFAADTSPRSSRLLGLDRPVTTLTHSEQVLERVVAGIAINVMHLLRNPITAPLAHTAGAAEYRGPLAHPPAAT
jgi:hypothetical protein